MVSGELIVSRLICFALLLVTVAAASKWSKSCNDTLVSATGDVYNISTLASTSFSWGDGMYAQNISVCANKLNKGTCGYACGDGLPCKANFSVAEALPFGDGVVLHYFTKNDEDYIFQVTCLPTATKFVEVGYGVFTNVLYHSVVCPIASPPSPPLEQPAIDANIFNGLVVGGLAIALVLLGIVIVLQIRSRPRSDYRPIG